MEWPKQALASEWQHNLQRQRSRNDAENAARYFAQHFVQASQREKSEMRPIENPAVHVIESAEEQAKANDKVGHIRNGDNQFSGFLQRREALSQYRGRIAQVFEDVSEQNVVELSAVRKLEGFQIRQLKRIVEALCFFRYYRIVLDAKNRMATGSQYLSQIAAGSPDIENLEAILFRLEDFQDPVMAAVLEGLKFIAKTRRFQTNYSTRLYLECKG